MKMLVLASLLCIAGGQLVNSQAVNSTCPSLTPAAGVDLDKVVGVWYLHEIIGPTIVTVNNVCSNLKLRTIPGGIFGSIGLNYKDHSIDSVKNDTYVVADPVTNPGLWVLSGSTNTSAVVLDQAADGSTVAMNSCVQGIPSEFITVFGRSVHGNVSHLDAANARLLALGINMNRAYAVNTSGCIAINNN